MFRSKIRNVIIPQSEHARLAGTLAMLWGSDAFDRPVLPFASFINGVLLHDREYDLIDNHPIMGMDASTWLAIKQKALNYGSNDPVVDAIVFSHVRRLVGHQDTLDRRQLADDLDTRIAECIAQTDWTPNDFRWADSITDFCDMVAFHLSFEAPTTAQVSVNFQRDNLKTCELSYEILESGRIHVTPWPFSVEQHTGFIMGYRAEGYPDKLDPLAVPFTLAQH